MKKGNKRNTSFIKSIWQWFIRKFWDKLRLRLLGKPKLPGLINKTFLKELIIYFGETPGESIPGDWKEFIQQYPHLRPKVEKFLEEATTGNPPWEMYRMVCFCGSSRKWAEREIPKVKVGNPADAIYHMVHICGSPREWAEREIPKVTVGNPTRAIYLMVRHCGSSREWAEREIPKVTIGDPAWVMYCMVHECGSSREWAEREIPKVTVGDIGDAILYMVCVCGSSKEWANKAIRENKKWRELGLNYLKTTS